MPIRLLTALLLALSSSIHAAEVTVTSMGELQSAVTAARPGDVVILSDGSYAGEDATLTGRGTETAPIVIRAATRGHVTIESPIELTGEWVTLEGCRFAASGSVQIEGVGIRLTRCTFQDSRERKWVRVRPGSRRVEIDHNRFSDKTVNREADRGCQLLQIVVRNQGEAHHVHHNHFLDVPEGKSSNGYETVQLITEGNPFDPEPGACETLIEQNLFERCNGEAEIISVKSNGNFLRNNTFIDSRGGLVLRHGDGNTVTGCFFIGSKEPRSGGVRMQGEDQVVVNNCFFGLGSYAVGMMDGTPDDLYMRTQRAVIAFNTFVGSSPAIVVGMNHSRHPNGTPPVDCIIANNVFVPDLAGRAAKEGTVRLVQGDEPENWTWQANITSGALGMPPRDGIQTRDPGLDLTTPGLAIPRASSPLIGASEGDFPGIATDILGRPRPARKTIGAFEGHAAPASGGPLTPAQVGPDAP